MSWRKDFFPERESEMLAWARNFAAHISDQPQDWSLTPQQVAEYDALVLAFEESMRIAGAPSTRTKVTVERKNALRREVEQASRRLARQVGAQPHITAAQRAVLGLKSRPARLSRVAGPQLAPQLTIDSVQGNVVTLRLRDASGQRQRGLPADVQNAMVFSYVGATPPVGQNGWMGRGVTTRTKVPIAFGPDVAPGAKIWFSAMWCNRRGRSPGATPVSIHLQQGVCLPRRAA